MGVTLTNKVIKDTYDGLLKFEDNKSASIAPRIITDGFGNDLGVKIGTDSVILEKGYTEMSISEINSEADGSVLVSKEWSQQLISNNTNTIAYDFYGDGVKTSFDFTLDFSNYIVQAWNTDTGDYLAQGAGFTISRSGSIITLDFASPLTLNSHYQAMFVYVYGPVY